MIDLAKIIRRAKVSKQEFAEITKIPYYRIAVILYGQDVLTKEERKRITDIFGENIFFATNYTKCVGGEFN